MTSFKFARLIVSGSILAMICQSLIATAAPHLGLLANNEMALVLENGKNTQRLLLPEQKLSAGWPFDLAPGNLPTGFVRCTVETLRISNGAARFNEEPDLYCSYTKEEICDVQANKRLVAAQRHVSI